MGGSGRTARCQCLGMAGKRMPWRCRMLTMAPWLLPAGTGPVSPQERLSAPNRAHDACLQWHQHLSGQREASVGKRALSCAFPHEQHSAAGHSVQSPAAGLHPLAESPGQVLPSPVSVCSGPLVCLLSELLWFAHGMGRAACSHLGVYCRLLQPPTSSLWQQPCQTCLLGRPVLADCSSSDLDSKEHRVSVT